MSGPIEEKHARGIWAILVEHCGFKADAEDDFVVACSEPFVALWIGREADHAILGGDLGPTALLWNDGLVWRVTVGAGSHTRGRNEMIDKANHALREFYQQATQPCGWLPGGGPRGGP